MNALTKSTILLVSGPSGAGKSTFIQQFRKKNLPEHIAAIIPAEASDWHIVEANDITKGDLDVAAILARIHAGENLIVHYDIVFIHCRQKTPTYENDLALSFITHAEKIHSFFIQPKPDMLREQFEARSTKNLYRKSFASRLWTRIVRTPLRELRSLIKPKKSTSTRALYQREGFITACYQQWNAYLESLAINNQIPTYTLEPFSPNQTSETFRIIATNLPSNHS